MKSTIGKKLQFGKKNMEIISEINCPLNNPVYQAIFRAIGVNGCIYLVGQRHDFSHYLIGKSF